MVRTSSTAATTTPTIMADQWILTGVHTGDGDVGAEDVQKQLVGDADRLGLQHHTAQARGSGTQLARVQMKGGMCM